jgi:DNA-binding FadR family transcriptional regulator
VRLVLETSSTTLAATRGSDQDIKRIVEKADFTYIYQDHQSYSAFLKQNAEFHISIAASTLNQRLVFLVSKTMDELSRVFQLGLDLKDSAEEMRQDHLTLAKALFNHDALLAETLVRQEIIHSRQRVMDALEKKKFASSLMPLNYVKKPIL